jgi:GTP-binding protein
MFVDLPGYGYARVPLSVRKTWGPMVETYLKKRTNLKGVVLIMDIRRLPGQKETDLINWLGYHRIAQILVLTKADKLSRSKQIQQQLKAAELLGFEKDLLVLFSIKTRKGKNELWKALERLL